MATFSKTLFSNASYAAFRPPHAQSTYNTILSYHTGTHNLCLDLGTGHGIVARQLSSSFKEVLGVDPSPGMIAQAVSLTPTSEYPNVKFHQSNAESLSFVQDGSADVVLAAQAVHWFDQATFWPEMRRVVRKGGTAAFWSYGGHVLLDYPRANEAMRKYMSSEEDWGLGRYWPQPGISIISNRLRDIIPPEQDWEDVRRVEYKPVAGKRGRGEEETILTKRMRVLEIEDFMRTWSAVHEWREAHPNMKSLRDGGNGDVIDKMMEDMQKSENPWRHLSREQWKDQEIDVEWGGALILARRR